MPIKGSTDMWVTFPNGLRKRILYDHGLPFSKGLDKNLDACKERIVGRKASLIVVDGGVGQGKTTLATHCADYFRGEYIDMPRQIAMGGLEFQEKLQICVDASLSVVVYDEAGDFARRGALTAFNQQLNRVFETYRGLQVFVIVVLPSIRDLDYSLLNKGIVRFLLHCEGRKVGYGQYRAYSAYRIFHLLNEMKKCTVPHQAYRKVAPNLFGKFLDLTPDRSRVLDALSTKGKREILSDNIIKGRGLASIRDIASQYNRSEDWVREVIRDKGIKEQIKYKRQRYFKPEDIKRISSRLRGKK